MAVSGRQVTTAGAETAALSTMLSASPSCHPRSYPHRHSSQDSSTSLVCRQMTTVIVSVDNHDVIEMHNMDDDHDDVTATV